MKDITKSKIVLYAGIMVFGFAAVLNLVLNIIFVPYWASSGIVTVITGVCIVVYLIYKRRSKK